MSQVRKSRLRTGAKVLEDRLGRSYPDMAWEPKAAFTALADFYHG